MDEAITQILGAGQELAALVTDLAAHRQDRPADDLTTALATANIDGEQLTPGDKAVLFYLSANRDEAVFADPGRFDISRSPNPHVGFGAAGPHFCLGAHLARRAITAILRELLQRVPDIRAAAEPDRLLSSFINGIKHLPVEFGL
jgi:methyl-branched lipid omega-hydroxylase